MIDFIKAKVILIMIVFVWVTIILTLYPLYFISGLLRFISKRGAYFNLNLWLVSDVFVNVILSGNYKTTVSAEVGKMAMNGSKTALIMESIINLLFKILVNQDDHCRASIEDEDIFTYSGKYSIIGFSVFMFAMHFDHVEYLTKLINPF